ncbi:PREDICTED: uncharacterized protein LOC105565372 [Vollenhovia emeryi]|uniref:uncharacterized protein LOC105565372 n=1 Tax=Vollenhovia emeryi TaxID=411798 RepID=UPI0005F38D8B|nr:PREDICTED: uncharacterized protein LOC105565372 [Vollenhovia emeryi]
MTTCDTFDYYLMQNWIDTVQFTSFTPGIISHDWKNGKFSCDSSRANDESLIKPLRRPLTMILRNVESRDVFGITKQLCTHNDKRKRLLQGKRARNTCGLLPQL